MFDTVCTFPLSSDLIAQAVHPKVPLVAVGLSAGHVATIRLPPLVSSDAGSDDDTNASVNGFGQIETTWRTKRHKGSCRSLAYTLDGTVLFSAGTDGLIKAADSETGQVVDKIALPLDPSNDDIDEPSLIHILSPQTLLAATDSSALHLYDLRTSSTTQFIARKPAQTHHPHSDYISSLTPLPPSEASTSGFSKQWVSVGGSTLSVTDLRRGVLVRSEDQEEELLSSCFVSGVSARRGGTSRGEKVIVGGANGVLTLWERGVWDDQDERIIVDRGEAATGGGESLDVIEVLPDGVGGSGKILAVGLGDGFVRFVKLGINKVIDQLRHDDIEGVVGLGFDVGGRMVTGGGSVIKVWHEKVDEDQGAYVDGAEKRGPDSDSDQDDNDNQDESSDEEDTAPTRKKRRKRNKGKVLPEEKSFSFAGLD